MIRRKEKIPPKGRDASRADRPPGRSDGRDDRTSISFRPKGVAVEMISRFLLTLLIIALALGAARIDTGAEEGEILYWTCGMHPSVRSDEAGKCPICNMDLVPVMKEKESASAAGRAVELVISEDAARLARIRTVPLSRMMLSLPIDAPGEIVEDESRVAAISSRSGGWIERLHADETGLELHRGDPLAEIYSPELVSAQKEYLLARGSELEASARKKLLLLGLTEKQVDRLHDADDISTTLTILAPSSGTIMHRGVSEGEYVAPGTTLFHLADLSRLWVIADIFENDITFIRAGQTARIEIEGLDGEELVGSVAFIEPYTDRSTRSTRVRIEIENRTGALRPGMFASVRIEAPLGGMGAGEPAGDTHMAKAGVLALPRSAVINTGRRTVAFVETGPGRYTLRNVKLGPIAGDYYVVLDGLSEGELVVERGSFLLDSQARLTGQAEEIYGGALGKDSEKIDPHAGHNH